MRKLNLQTVAVTSLVIVGNFPLAKGAAAMVAVTESGATAGSTVKKVAVMADRGKIVMMGRVGAQLAATPAAAAAEVEDSEGLGTATDAHTPQKGVYEDHRRQRNTYHRPHRRTL